MEPAVRSPGDARRRLQSGRATEFQTRCSRGRDRPVGAALASHSRALAAVALEPDLWRLQPRRVESDTDMEAYVALALREQQAGESLPFVIVEQTQGLVIGSTRFMDIAMQHRRLEIGASWITPAYQRTGANLEAKLLLLSHAFEVLDMQKVVLKTETLNTQSRAAILGLGAVEEGTFRRQFLADDGRPRDMIYFSILDEEWPNARDRIRKRLARHRT